MARHRKPVEVPEQIAALIDRVVTTPFLELPAALAGFTWTFEKGETAHWAKLFQHFEHLVAEHIAPRSDVHLKPDAKGSDGPFPSGPVKAMLQLTAKILDNCSNKHNFRSQQALCTCLGAPDPEVLVEVLKTLVSYVRRSHTSSIRFQGYQALSNRLTALASGWGGKEEGVDLATCVTSNPTPEQQRALSKGADLRFSFYKEAGGSGSGEDAAGMRIIHAPQLGSSPGHSQQSDLELLESLMTQHQVPDQHRFMLLLHIRLARSFPDLRQRRMAVQARLLAFHVLFQSSLNQDSQALAADAEFVPELMGLLAEPYEEVGFLQVAALRALAVQLLDRRRSGAIITALGQGGQSSQLSRLVYRAVTGITSPAASQDQSREGNQLLDAVLSLLGALVASGPGCSALSQAGVVPALLPLLQERSAADMGLMTSTVRILEAFMEFSPNSAGMLRDMGGVETMTGRLRAEVGLPREMGPPGRPPAARAGAGQEVPYSRRLLLKSLLRAIALASYTPSSGPRPQVDEARPLFECLRVIFADAKDFGGGLFALAASVMTDRIHHDPLCFRTLDEAGLPEAFLAAVQAGILPSGEALGSMPNTLVALCLNTGGLERVQSSHALEVFADVFTTRTYQRCLGQETPSILGQGLDELMRHVPQLRSAAIDVVVTILHRLHAMGKGQSAPEGPPRSSPGEGGDAGGDSTMADNREAGGQSAAGEAAEEVNSAQPSAMDVDAPEQSVAAPAKDAAASAFLADCISHTARMLNSLFADASTAREFVDRGGIELLLGMYSLPRLPPMFASSHAGHALNTAMRSFTSSHGARLSLHLSRALSAQLKAALTCIQGVEQNGFGDLPDAGRDEIVARVSAADGLVALTGPLVRVAPAMLLEVSKGSPCPLQLLGQLERAVLQHAFAEEWRLMQGRQSAQEGSPAQGPADEGPSTSAGTASEPSGTRVVVEVTDLDMLDTDAPVGEDSSREAAAPPEEASPQEAAVKVLHGFTDSARNFQVQLAKAVHSPGRSSRSHQEAAGPTGFPARAAAAYLALVLRDNLSQPQAPVPDGEGRIGMQASIQYCHFLGRAVEEIVASLFNMSRVSCHSVVLSYFVRLGGMQVMVSQFAAAVQLLWHELELHQQSEPQRGTDPVTGSSEAGPSSAAAPSGPQAAGGSSQEAPPASEESHGGSSRAGPLSGRRVAQPQDRYVLCETCIMAFLLLLQQLCMGLLQQEGPRAAQLLATPLPGQPQKDAPTAPAIIKRMQATVLEAVLPLWADPKLAKLPRLHVIVVRILTQVNEASGLAASVAQAAPPAPPAVNQASLQQIVDMGFSAARAELALRRIATDSVELAMEWMDAHPEEPPPPPAPGGQEAAPAGSATPSGQPEEDPTVVGNVKAALGSYWEAAASPVPPSGEASTSEAPAAEAMEQQEAEAKLPSAQSLVDGALSIAVSSPDVSYSVASLLSSAASANAGRDAAAIAQGMMRHLEQAADGAPKEADKARERDEQLRAPAHLLALLCSDSQPACWAAVQNGLSPLALKLLRGWTATHVGSPGSPPAPIPLWVQAMLLVLYAALQATPPASMAVPQDPRGAAPASQEGPGGTQEPAATPDDAPQPESAAAVQQGGQAAAGPPQSGEAPAEQSQQALLESLIGKLQGSGGLVDEQQQEQALELVLQLLRHLHTWAPSWEPPQAQPAGHAGLEGPAPCAHAVLLLLARLTRSHSIALKVLAAKGHRAVLDLPRACHLPDLEMLIYQIWRHILEDPITLQAAMEAEITATLTTSPDGSTQSEQARRGGMPITSMLRQLRPVIAREPAIFVKALAATCHVEEWGSRAMVMLRSTKQDKQQDKPGDPAAPQQPSGVPPATPAPPQATPGGPQPTPAAPQEQPVGASVPRASALKTPRASGKESRTPFRAGKKAVPPSFVEVIDCLVDLVVRYRPPDPEPAHVPSPGDPSAPAEQPEASTGAEGAAAASSGADGAEGPYGAHHDAPLVRRMSRTGSARPMSRLLRSQDEDMEGLVGRHGRGGASRRYWTSGGNPRESEAGQAQPPGEPAAKDLTEAQHAALQQFMALKVLTNSTLMYSSCVGVLLKRDTDMPGRMGASPRARDGKPGKLFRHVMLAHLMQRTSLPKPMPGLSEQASFFLLAVCIRSAEGRRRIAGEISAALGVSTGGPVALPQQKFSAGEVAASPFRSLPGWPEPCQIQYLVDLVGALLSANANAASQRRQARLPGVTVETVRTMKEAGMISALTNAAGLLDLDHPKASEVVGALLKPLEILVRPLPARKPAEAAGQDRQGPQGIALGASQPPGGSAAPTGTAQQPPVGQPDPAAQAPDTAMTEQDSREEAAGPEAQAAASAAMHAFGNRGTGHAGPRSLENMLEAMMEQGYMDNASDADDTDDEDGMHDHSGMMPGESGDEGMSSDEGDEVVDGEEDDDADDDDESGDEDDSEDDDDDDGHDDEDDTDMDDEEAAYALHHGPGAHAAPGDSEDEDGVGVYDVDEEDEDEGEHTEDDEEDPIEELLVGELDDGDLADDHDGLVHTEMVPLDGEQGPAGFVAGELDGDSEEEDSLGAEEEEEDLDGAEADFWDEEAAEDEHHRFMDPDPGRLQWVGGPPFRMGGGMPPPRGMEGGSFGATQAMISELLNNSLEQTMVMGSHGGRGGRYMIGQTGQLAQRQAGAPAAVPRPHPLLQRPPSMQLAPGGRRGEPAASDPVESLLQDMYEANQRYGEQMEVLTWGPGGGSRLAEGGRSHRHIPWRVDEPPPFFMPPGALGPNSPAIHMSLDALFNSRPPQRLPGPGGIARGQEGAPGGSWADEGGAGNATGLPAELTGTLERQLVQALRTRVEPQPEQPAGTQPPSQAGPISQALADAAAALGQPLGGGQPPQGPAAQAQSADAAASALQPPQTQAQPGAEPMAAEAAESAPAQQPPAGTGSEDAARAAASMLASMSAGPSGAAPMSGVAAAAGQPSAGSEPASEAAASMMASALAAMAANPSSAGPSVQQSQPPATSAAMPATAAAEDVEMRDARESAETVAEPAEQAVQQGPSSTADTAMAAPQPNPILQRLAEEAGIELAFLEALPPELMNEVLAANNIAVPAPSVQPPAAPPAQPPTPQDQPEQPAEAGPSRVGPSGETADEMEEMGIDPEFLAALPPELQAEVLQQQRSERGLAARQASGAPPSLPQGMAVDMDFASILATFPPEVRDEALMGLVGNEEVLSTLPPMLLAEAHAVQERRGYRQPRGHPPAPVAPDDLMAMFDRTRGGPAPGAGAVGPLAGGPPGGAPGGGEAGQIPQDRQQALLERMRRDVLARSQQPQHEPALVDDPALLNLVALLQLPIPLSKFSLSRLYLNLCLHPDTCTLLLRCLLALLRAPIRSGATPQGIPGNPLPYPAQHTGRRAPRLPLLAKEDGSGMSITPHLFRRVLELLGYLVRARPKVSTAIMGLRVPAPQILSAEAPDEDKGKRRPGEALSSTSAPEEGPLKVLLQLLGQDLCRRVNSHLEQALILLDLVLTHAKLNEDGTPMDRQAEVQALIQEQLQRSRGAGSRAPPQFTDPSRPGRAPMSEAIAAAFPGTALAPPSTPTAAPQPGSVQLAVQQPGPAQPAVQQAGSTSPPAPEGAAGQEASQQPSTSSGSGHRPVQEIPEQLLGQLPQLLGQQGLTSSIYQHTASCLQRLARLAPEHKPLLLEQLQAQVTRLAEPTLQELQQIASCAELAAGPPGPGLVSLGNTILHILQALTSIVLPAARDPSAIMPLSLLTRRRDMQTVSEADAAALEGISRATGGLWQVLSQCVARIETGLQAAAPEASPTGQPGSRMLPTGAAQVLPLVEAFFQLGNARMTAQGPQGTGQDSRGIGIPPLPTGTTPGPPSLTPQPSMELVGRASVAGDAQGGPSAEASETSVAERQAPFIRFMEKHRTLLNVVLRRSPDLLQGSLSPLLRAPRFIDFDNKRAFFRACVRSSRAQAERRSQAIYVRREQVFEDSFHQLRHKDMRGKLVVHFQNEEGIDAGGVSREWFQVMARKMVNPDISLFHPVPEGALTYQPNANSIVQNDEARGVDHLDFFRFVGRIVGKALFDGQHIDAYFTRSFYKHMLGQRLTYQDIEAVDPDFYKNLVWMLENDIEGVLDLTFTEESDYFGRTELVDLKPDGSNIRVTEATKREYVDLVARHRMTTAIKPQIQAFLGGFWELVPKELITIFNDLELELLISGLPEIDVGDLRANTEYSGYTAASRVVQWFWECVDEMGKQDRALLVQFVTGTSKVPLDGFRGLQGISGPQRFQIHKAYGAVDRLPSAHTCFNQLDLLEYETKEQLRERLLLAMHEGSEGFGFG